MCKKNKKFVKPTYNINKDYLKSSSPRKDIYSRCPLRGFNHISAFITIPSMAITTTQPIICRKTECL